jgi:hypothetical protein
MLAQADAQIKAAQATAAHNNNIDNQVALTNALANREGVLAQIEGLRSEQKANDLALNKELLDLTKTKNEAETQLAIDHKQFDAERLKDEEAILLAKKSALEFAQTQELERLQNVIETTKQGTQARIDAENEYAAKKQEIENQITTAQDEIDTYRFNKKLEKEQLIIENDKLSFSAKLEALTDYSIVIPNNDNEYMEDLIACYKNNSLVKKLCSSLKTIYKKKNPKEQSLWTSDVTRNNYVYKHTTWLKDPQGKNISETIIKPFLNALLLRIKKYYENLIEKEYMDEENTENELAENDYNKLENMENKIILSRIMSEIIDGKIEELIIKELAPDFYLNSEIIANKNNKEKVITN